MVTLDFIYRLVHCSSEDVSFNNICLDVLEGIKQFYLLMWFIRKPWRDILTYYLSLITYYLLVITYYLLLTTYHLLLTTYYLSYHQAA